MRCVMRFRRLTRAVCVVVAISTTMFLKDEPAVPKLISPALREHALTAASPIANAWPPVATDNTFLDLAMRLTDEITASGGIVDPRRARFHQFPGDPMSCITAWPVPFLRNVGGTVNRAPILIKIDLREEIILRKSIVRIDCQPSAEQSGFVDVLVRFSGAIHYYAKQRQLERDFAAANQLPQADMGFSFVFNGAIHSMMNYGVLAELTESSAHWVRVATCVDPESAEAIARSLLE